jgi:hypothetical protein
LVAVLLDGVALYPIHNAAEESANILTVNDTGDGVDVDPGNGLCETATPGECTLRSAIMESNASTGITYTIAFSITGVGPFTIAPGSALPEIARPIIIDGLTQPGASCESWPPTLLIELDGTSVPGIPGIPPTPPIGLRLATNDSVVRGLVINRFQDDVFPFGNIGSGVAIDRGDSNTVVCNFVGTEPDGDTPAPNQFGISLGNANSNVITRNLVSGNDDIGIVIAVDPLAGGESDGNRIYDNYIGTDKTGTLDRGNASDGVLLVNARNTVIANNLISGNGDDGVDVADTTDAPARSCTTPPCATGNRVVGNMVGTDASGNLGVLGNGDNGVEIKGAENNLVANNLIAGSGVHGVQIDDLGSCTKGTSPCAVNNTIRANSIFSNTRLGIDLLGGSEDGYGVTANDVGDGDGGSNMMQNYPLLDSARIIGGALEISGTLHSRAHTPFTLEIYANPACDPSGYGEGQTFLISDTVMTDGSGDGAFLVTTAPPADRSIVATATDPDGSTSEFSACVPLVKVLPTYYTLTALTSPTVGGAVTLDPPGGMYEANTVVELTANPAEGYEFVRWSGDLTSTANPDIITVTQDMTVSASFDLAEYYLYLPVVFKKE